MNEEKRPQAPASPTESDESEPTHDPDELEPTETWPAARYWEIALPPQFERTPAGAGPSFARPTAGRGR